MQIEKLRLKGFIGIKRGLGLDEISIDFKNIVGLIAFAGQNGLGKSTVLENLHPFNTLASRSGALFNHVCVRDAEKELFFSYNGNHYRTLIKIDCQSEKSEGFIWKDGESLVNGKIRDYAKYMTDLFGSSNLFFNSVFCAQNAQKLSDMTTGQLKTLFAEFLRLDRLQDYEETAKQVINVLTGKSGQIDINIEAIGKRMEGVTNLRAEIEKLSTLKAEQETYKTEQIEKLKTSQIEREKLKEDIARNEVLNKQIESMAAIIADMEKNRDQEGVVVEAQLNKLRTQYQEYSREIADADKILIDEPAMLDATEKVTKLTSFTETLTGKIDAENIVAQKTQVDINVIETGLQNLKHTLKDLENDSTLNEINTKISIIEQKIENCTAQLKQMEGRDKDCTSSTCQFILAAHGAETELSGAQNTYNLLIIEREVRQKKITDDSADLTTIIGENERWSKEMGAFLRSHQENASTYRKELANARMELTRYQNLTAKQTEIAVAKSQKADREKALAENKKQGLAISAEWKIKSATLAEQIAKQNEKLNNINVRINKTADEELKSIERNMGFILQSIKDKEETIAEFTTKIAALQNDLSGITEAEELLRKENENKIRLTADIADWTYLKNACGKNGLQAMEIDGAAPLITGYANDLLSQAFGSLYAVKFLTQDEEGKECLDIITIGEDGEEILLDNLSGGQKCWILMALRLAMTLLSKEKGGRNFQAAFFDELDGPLDAENAVNFINLYKSFMEIGHFETVSFISHKEECRSMADHVLMFEAGKTPYWN
jgi:exonuclease SbcC